MHMKYRLSLLIPVRFRSRLNVSVSRDVLWAGRTGNHRIGDTHTDAERVTWWQWRGHVMRYRTVRICQP